MIATSKADRPLHLYVRDLKQAWKGAEKRDAPSWSAGEERKFRWTDTVQPGSKVTLSNVKIKAEWIESTQGQVAVRA